VQPYPLLKEYGFGAVCTLSNLIIMNILRKVPLYSFVALKLLAGNFVNNPGTILAWHVDTLLYIQLVTLILELDGHFKNKETACPQKRQ